MEKYGFVYIWMDRKYPRFYIGSHWGFETDKYVCSSIWMRNAYKRRPEDFKRRILARVYTSRQDLLLEEGKWLALIPQSEIGKRYYNLHNQQPGHWSANEDLKISIGKKISKDHRGFNWYTDGQRDYQIRKGDEVTEGLVKGKGKASRLALKGHYDDYPEARLVASKRTSLRYEDPKEHDKSSVAQLNRYEDPVYCERHSIIMGGCKVRIKSLKKSPKHGTSYMYNHYRCRCRDCKDANSQYNREYRVQALYKIQLGTHFYPI